MQSDEVVWQVTTRQDVFFLPCVECRAVLTFHASSLPRPLSSVHTDHQPWAL